MKKYYSSVFHSLFIFPDSDKTRFVKGIFYLLLFIMLLPINAMAQQWHYFKELPVNAVPKSVASNNEGTLFLLTTDNKVFYKTTEGSWTNITYWGLISAESISADKASNRVYIGTSYQGLLYSSDLGAAWQSIWMETNPSSGHHEGYGSFAQTGNPNLFFAGHLGMPKITVFTAQGASGSVKTISGNPNASPSALYYTNDEKLLVGNHLGIWISTNNGNSFSQTTHSSGHVFCFTQDENGRAYALNRNISTQEITLLYSDDYSTWSLMELPDPGEAYTTIFYNSGTQELWLGSTQGIYSSPVQNNNWENKNFNNSSHSVRQILNDHNGSLYNFSLEHAVQKLNDVNDGWIDMTQGLSGVVDDLVFSSENVLFAYNHFFSNKVSILANPSQNWIGSRLGSELSGVRNLFITEDGMVFGNTHKKVFRIEGSGPTFTEFSPPGDFSTQTSGGISIFKKGLQSGIFIGHSFIPQKIFGSFDSGNSWQVISDISGPGVFSTFSDFAQDAGGRYYCILSGNQFKVYTSLTGEEWDLIPFDYEDFSVSFDSSEIQCFGNRIFIIGNRHVFEIITDQNLTSLVSISTPFINSENPLTDFKYTETGDFIINSYINGVYQSSDNGLTWEHFGFPTTWVNDNTPLTTLDSYDTLPFIVMKENNAQNIAPGIYYYFPDILSTDNFEAKGGIYLYPNPVTSKLYVQSPEEIKSITIFDSSGRLVLSSSGNDNIDVSALSKGYYIIVVNTVKGSRFKGKFIKK